MSSHSSFSPAAPRVVAPFVALVVTVTLVVSFAPAMSSPMDQAAPNRETPFGHGLLPLFAFEDGYVNVNHGSYGAPPRAVIEAQHRWQTRMEQNPDRWFRYEMPAALRATAALVAAYINAGDAKEVVFVQNASQGVNAVLRSTVHWQPGDQVLCLSEAYVMVKKTLEYLRDEYGVQVLQVDMQFTTGGAPYDEQQLLRRVADVVADPANARIKLAIFSHISSTPAVILPVQQLTQICHDKNIPVIIDGAHVIGQIPLDVRSIGCDYYVSNAHKWLYAPRGSAFLWTAPEKQAGVHPTVISEGYRRSYVDEFGWVGTGDMSSFLTVADSLKFRQSLGDDRIMNYMHSLAIEAGRAVAKLWRTELLIEDERLLGAMVNIRLPVDALMLPKLSGAEQQSIIDRIAERLVNDYHTFLVMFQLEGRWYARLSAQIYNELEDFVYVANAVLHIISEFNQCPRQQ